MRRLVFLCSSALIASASVTYAQSLPPIEASLIKDTNTAPGRYGSYPRSFRTIDDRVYFSASTPATGTELYSTDGTPGGLRLEYDLAPGALGAEGGPIALARLGAQLIVAASGRLWAYGNGTAVALTPPSAFNPAALPNRAMGEVGGRLLIAPDTSASEQIIWVTDGTPAGTYPQDAANGFSLPTRSGNDCALATGVLHTVGLASNVLIRNDGTVAGSEAIATLEASVQSTALLDGRCYFAAGGPDGAALWVSDGTAQGTAEVDLHADEEPAAIVAMNGNLYVATRNYVSNHFLVRRYAPTNLAQPSTILDVPAAVATLVATRHALLAFVIHDDDSSTVWLGDGSTNLQTIYTAPPGNRGLRAARHVQGDAVFVMTTPLPTRIDATTGAITTTSTSGTALLRSLAAPLGDDVIGPGSIDDELWISDGTDAGTQQLNALWPDTAHGFDNVFGLRPSAVLGNVLVYGNALLDENTLWRTDGTAQGTWALPSSALGGAAPHAVAAIGESLAVKARDAAGVTQLYRTDAQLADATFAGTTYSSTNAFITNGDVALLDCGGSLATLTLCALTPQAAAPAPIDGPPIANPELDDTTIVALGNLGGAAIFYLRYANEVWRSDGTSPGTFRLSAGDWVREAATPHPVSIEHDGKIHFAACRTRDDCSLHATDGTVAGTTIVAPLGLTTGIVDAWFERYGDGFVVGLRGFPFGGIWRSDGTAAGTTRIMSGSFDQFALSVVGDRIHYYTPSGFFVSDGTQAGTHEVPRPTTFAAFNTGLFQSIGNATIFGCWMASAGSAICAIDREGTSITPVATIAASGRGTSIEYLGRTSDAIYVIADDYVHGREPWRIGLRDAIFANGFETEP
jgi:ELWxxDGT repeat protein